MFAGKTVFVVGAGASKEVGLPTGAELKRQIADLLGFQVRHGVLSGGDKAIQEALRRCAASDVMNPHQTFTQYVAAARNISESLPSAYSIDTYLHHHQGDDFTERCGKIAIARAILKAERESDLYVSDDNINNKLDLRRLDWTEQKPEAWYLKFAELLFSGPKEELADRLSKIEFIVFNYDRCIEQFLFWVLRIHSGFAPEEAAGYASLVKLYHPYGCVGKLPHQKGGTVSVRFGDEDCALLPVSEQIKTFTEGTDPDSSEIVALRKSIEEAEIVVFLGFGFHPLNMALISPKASAIPAVSRRKAYYATATGLSNSDTEIVKGQLASLCSNRTRDVHVRNDLKCHKLFSEYHLSLFTN